MNDCKAFLKIKNGNIVNTITESEEEVNVLFETVNKALKELYAAEEAKKNFKTFKQIKDVLKRKMEKSINNKRSFYI